MNKIVISKLISVANELDAMGNHDDADRLTDLANSYNAPNKEDIDLRMDKSFEDSDDYQALHQILEEMLNSGEINSKQKTQIENVLGDSSTFSDYSNDDGESMNVKELSNPIDSGEMKNTDIKKPNDEDLESLFADDPELLEWWRNLGNNNNE